MRYMHLVCLQVVSGEYDYARSGACGYEIPCTISEGHYEFNLEEEEPYWEPASREDDLKQQLYKLGVTDVSIESVE